MGDSTSGSEHGGTTSEPEHAANLGLRKHRCYTLCVFCYQTLQRVCRIPVRVQLQVTSQILQPEMKVRTSYSRLHVCMAPHFDEFHSSNVLSITNQY